MKKINKIIIMLLCLVLVIGAMAVSAMAAEEIASGREDEDFAWKLTDDGVLTISGEGEMRDYVNAPWYEHREKIVKVVIEEGITKIGADAFRDCENITSIAIPASVSIVGEDAFYNCESLTQLSVSENSQYLANGENGILLNKNKDKIVAFTPGRGGSYTIPEGITTIGRCAFSDCDKLTEVIIPEGVTEIEYYAFAYCNGLTSINIPSSVTNIEEGTFDGCASLKDVTFAGTVDRIKQYAFRGCPITEITIPDGTDRIGIGAFSYCFQLTKVTLPDSVTVIEDEAFGNCNNLTSINIPANLRFIGYYAFRGCEKLDIVLTIPAGVTNICGEAFTGCTSISEIRFEGDAPSIEDNVFWGMTVAAYYPEGNETWTSEVKQNYGGTITWAAYTPESSDEDLKGDVNLDGKITNTDLVIIARSIVGLETDENIKTYGDMNGDGNVNNADLIAVARIIVGITE